MAWGGGWAADGADPEDALEQSPGAIFNPDYSLVRLRLWERMLHAADAAGVRWQMGAELG
jgi:hypothetical protein